MVKKKEDEHWAFQVLRKRLAEKTETFVPPPEQKDDSDPQVLRITRHVDHEGGTVFLFDPDLREELDDNFFNELYPLILNEFENQPFTVPPRDEIRLTDERPPIEGARNALFIMQDPARPVLSKNRPWWYIRFNLEVRVIRYMLKTELHLSLPFDTQLDWVLDLLVDFKDSNFPPCLTADEDQWILQFSWARGQSYLFAQEEWGKILTEPFRKHIGIAKAVDLFSRRPNNRLLKSNMRHLISEMYGK